MDGNLKKELMEAGINVDEAIERMMGYEDFFIQLLKKFAFDNTYEQLRQALKEGNPSNAFKAAHTLKGLSGDLSIDVLFLPLTEITDALRDDHIDQANIYMQEFSQLYDKVVSRISSIVG